MSDKPERKTIDINDFQMTDDPQKETLAYVNGYNQALKDYEAYLSQKPDKPAAVVDWETLRAFIAQGAMSALVPEDEYEVTQKIIDLLKPNINSWLKTSEQSTT